MRLRATSTTTPLLVLLLGFTLTTSGCRSLGDPGPVEESHAMSAPAGSKLAVLAATVETRLAGPGFELLADNAESLTWRLALIDSATTSLDLQTYLWNGDFSGRLLILRIWRAAERGVRVRLLDDFLLRTDRFVATLAEHPNIQIRIWNPGHQRAAGRRLEFLRRLRELNHRLHNKVLIADNVAVISGGRNVSDAYFGYSTTYNFFDVDLLGVGRFVADASAMFDRYWNSTQAVPARAMHRHGTAADIPAMMAGIRRNLASTPLSTTVPAAQRDWSDWLDREIPVFVTGDVEVIYDDPAERGASSETLYGLQRMFERATHEALVLNPYLVPAEVFFTAAGQLEARGVQMQILTNSLGSTNQTIVHSAYTKTRAPLLDAGVDVYELRHDPAFKDWLDSAPSESSWVGLHGKAAVVDRERLFVGSFNFSPRSVNINTEMGLLVESQPLAEELAGLFDRATAPDNAWHLTRDSQGRLAWESSDHRLTRQPSQGFWRRFQSSTFGLFPIQNHL